ncbi:hypothetical protein GCM10017691_22650 [Pseudonocardia petroleophila]|uniref:Uncharacterized protein n=1 Tax=Pseudonocardia petroleophila TaxID=37331 RepID=A0A7G7MG69_9PSEU|nr:hypothetical protein [Pseudonocardia petroleophila]QNG51780.1 hypothetical protein H6H00_27370 [Pseudonocardia petroleophila]
MTTIGRSATRTAWAGDSVVLGALVVAPQPGPVVLARAATHVPAPLGDRADCGETA